MTAYILAEISIHDRSRYGEYESGFMTPELGAAMARTSARFIAVDEAQVSLEGEHPYTRTVLVEFPDAEAARDFYESEEYQAIIGHRHAASTGSLTIINGMS